MTRAKIDANHHKATLVEDSITGSVLEVTGADLTNSQAMHVAIVDGDGSHITSFGGGTQYTEGATDATITGTAMLAEAPSNTLEALQVDASKHLQVDIAADSVGIGGGTQYDTNDAYADGNTGTLALTIRDDALTTLTEADGDYSGLRVDSTGRLWANVSNTVAVDATGQGDVPITLGGEAVVLGAGSAAIGKLAANSGVDIGDVDVASIAAGTNVIGKMRLVTATGDEITEDTDNSMQVTIVADDVGIGGGTQYAEDDQHNTGDTGTMALAVRNDTLAALATTDGDYAPLQVNASGALFIDVANGGVLESAVDGIETVLGTIDTDTGNIATSVSTVAGAVSGSEMQVDIVGITPDLMLGTDFSAVLGTTSLVTTAALGDNLSNGQDVLNVRSLGYVFDGSTWDRLRGDSTNGVLVNLGTNNDVTATNATHDNLNANANIQVANADASTSNPVPTSPQADSSAAGTSTYYDSDLDETKIEVTDNPNVSIYSIAAFNTTAAPLFLQMFDLDADSVTVGSTTPTNQYVIPGNADSDGSGFILSFAIPKSYTTGFTVACTTDSEGNSAPGAGSCLVNIEYASSA